MCVCVFVRLIIVQGNGFDELRSNSIPSSTCCRLGLEYADCIPSLKSVGVMNKVLDCGLEVSDFEL